MKQKLLCHEKIAIFILVLGLVLIALSSFFCCDNLDDILQGIGTGLISGVIVLWISAKKSKEEKQYSEAAQSLNNLAEGIENSRAVVLEFSYSTNKSEDQQRLINAAIQEFKNANQLIQGFRWNTNNDSLAEDILPQIKVFQSQMRLFEKELDEVSSQNDSKKAIVIIDKIKCYLFSKGCISLSRTIHSKAYHINRMLNKVNNSIV